MMISFNEAKRIYGSNKTIGQQVKEESDWLMEQSWDGDVASKVCYIYDYFHDDFIPYFESEYDVIPKYYYTLS